MVVRALFGGALFLCFLQRKYHELHSRIRNVAINIFLLLYPCVHYPNLVGGDRVHPKIAQTVLRRDKEDKEDKGDKGDSTETKKDICKNGMLPRRSL